MYVTSSRLLTVLALYMSYTSSTSSENDRTLMKRLPPQEEDRRPWTTHGINGSECGDNLRGIVECEMKDHKVSLKLKTCFCMTYNEDKEDVYVGHCAYTCMITSTVNRKYDISPEVQSVSLLNKEMCKTFHRKGQMCGHCQENYSLPVYSYSASCVPCLHDDYKYSWLKYIAIAYAPLTAFFFLVLILRISVTSGSVMGYVTISQLIATPSLIRFYFTIMENSSGNIKSVIKYLLVPHTLWNLDIFRTLPEPFCLDPRMTPMMVATLDYILAIYPMLLIVVCVIFVKLHDRYNLISWLWRPFYRCFAKFRRHWDMRFSLIHTFATFILLSYIKILNVSYELLAPSYHYYNINGTKIDNLYLAYDGTVRYLSDEHKPFAVLAITMTLFFNIVPLLLLLIYPCRCFQKCLSCTKLYQVIQTLNTFMDVFYGCFKHSPRDYRYFAGLYVLLRIVNLISLSAYPNFLFFSSASTVLTISGLTIAAFRPHRNPNHSVVDLTIILVNAGIYHIFSASMFAAIVDPKEVFFSKHGILGLVVIGFWITFLPFYGIAVLIIYKVMPIKVVRRLIDYVKLKWCNNQVTSPLTESEILPHRLVHCHEYASINDIKN